MHSDSWGDTQQVCVTCRYWRGRREQDDSGMFFTAESETGKCGCRQSGFINSEMGYMASCSEWEKF